MAIDVWSSWASDLPLPPANSPVAAGQAPPPEPLPAWSGAGLDELLRRHVLFTHGLWLSMTGGADDPVASWAAARPLEERPLELAFDACLIDWPGRPAEDWQRCLLLCPRSSWDDLRRTLAAYVLIDRDRRRLLSSRWQRIPLADPLVWQGRVSLPPRCPTLDLHVLGVSWAGVGDFLVRPARRPPLDSPCVVRLPADAQTARLADNVFGGTDNLLLGVGPSLSDLYAGLAHGRRA